MRAALLALTITTATVGAAAVAAGTVVAVRAGEALPGVSVAGTGVGGQGRATLQATVERQAAARTSGTLPVVADDVHATVDRSLVRVDVGATVQRALDAGRSGSLLSPITGPLGGAGRPDVALVLRPDGTGLDGAVTGLATKVDRPTGDGGVAIDLVEGAPKVTTTLPSAGRALDRKRARAALARALSDGSPGPLELAVQQQRPTATPAQVRAAAASATAALSASYVLSTGPLRLSVMPVELAPLLRPRASQPLQLDQPGVRALLKAKAAALATTPKRAGFDVAGTPSTVDSQGDLTWTPKPAEVVITASTPGREVDLDAAVARLTALVDSGGHGPVGLPVATTAAALTTEQAKAAGVHELMGTFTTYFQPGQPRVTNIRRIAEIVNGTYVKPGSVFSLNGTAGKRTQARGFVADGAIVNGKLIDEVGGGVSQFATTLFNAAYFAGLPIPEHTPHSFYISRYPAGRESTVYFGSLDVRIANDTGHGMLVRAGSTPRSVTVELYGDNGGRRVDSATGPRQPRGDGGFRIEVTRTVTGGDGKGGRRVFRTSYDPSPEE